jgi:hypothetical protein
LAAKCAGILSARPQQEDSLKGRALANIMLTFFALDREFGGHSTDFHMVFSGTPGSQLSDFVAAQLLKGSLKRCIGHRGDFRTA